MSIDGVKKSGPIKINDGSKPVQPNNNASKDSVDADLTALEQVKKDIRQDQAEASTSQDQANSARDKANLKANEARHDYSEAKISAANSTQSSENAKLEASQKRQEASMHKAEGRDKGPAAKKHLEEKAKRKEIEALEKEYEAQKALNAAFEEERRANALTLKAEEEQAKVEDNTRQANNSAKQSKTLEVQASSVDSEITAAKSSTPTSKDGGGATPFRAFSGPVSADGGPAVGGASGFNRAVAADGGPANGVGIFSGPVSANGGPPAETVGIAERSGGAGSTDMFNDYLGTERSSFAFGPAAPFVNAVRALFKQVMRNTLAPRATNPTNMVALHNNNKTLYDLAISILDAGQTQLALMGTVANQDLIFLRTQATAGKGEEETSIQYWIQMQDQNKQANKDTHKHAERA